MDDESVHPDSAKDAPRPLTHLDRHGAARVVDVREKAPTHRTATAVARVETKPAVIELIRKAQVAKGDVSAVARIAGIMAAKKASELIPLCHPLSLTHLAVDVHLVETGFIEITVRAECFERTGVEMEAMTGAAVAALSVYDMIKGEDRGARIAEVALVEKTGGRSGAWNRP